MQHALALARKGIGLASPNPTVGCVIVREGQIVGEGFHQYESRDHAEIVALKAAGEKARGATLYVTLEPCNHTSRTGPCAEAIIAAGMQRVVAAMDDPNPVNSGRGFERLRAAGIEVFTGVCEDEARRLNEAFAWWIRTKRPFVTLKSALTLDGQLALPHPGKKAATRSQKHSASEWITSEESRAEVQRMRHASDAQRRRARGEHCPQTFPFLCPKNCRRQSRAFRDRAKPQNACTAKCSHAPVRP